MITGKEWESVDFQILLKPPKNPDKSTAYSILHKEPVNKKLLFLDLPLPKDAKPTYNSVSLTEFTELKETNKKEFKKKIREFTIVVPTILASKILKLFGKVFQRYNKTPVLVSGTVDPTILEKRKYYRLESNRIQGKLGSVLEPESVLMDRLDLISESLAAKGYVIIKKTIKTTQGHPIVL